MTHSPTVCPLNPPEDEDLFDYYYNIPGSTPGTLSIDPTADATRIDIVHYGPDFLNIAKNRSPQEAFSCLSSNQGVFWIDVQGLGTESVLRDLGTLFQLPLLILEDVVNVPHRPKLEYHTDFLLIITQMVMNRPNRGFYCEQISFILHHNYLITIQEETHRDPFDPIRQRLEKNIGMIRRAGADYLCYALIDAIVDNYFPVLESYGDRLEDLEDIAVTNPTEETLNAIYDIRRELLSLRRNIWPQREIFNTLLRDGNPYIKPETLTYFRDCYDHTIQIIDVIETYREIASSLMDVYLSAMSNKLNEVMKTLTIISTIFIPLTFIAGIYGMNFNPDKSPFNMPELEWYWGYFLCLGVMGLITLIQLYLFKRRGWFKRSLFHRQQGR
ncbi:MAG: magnesium/cobalt transporter CorA [Synechocystis sp.]|nr:magnesium/cobalt transporter CorA [Synechocystis sp.]